MDEKLEQYVNGILFEPGMEKEKLFRFLDLSDASAKEEDRIILNERDFYKETLYNDDDKYYFSRRILTMFNRADEVGLLYKIPISYEVTRFNGYIYLTRKEIDEYKFIRKNAFTAFEEPLVILDNPNSCSRHFKIHKQSSILPFNKSQVILPVDLYQSTNLNTWWSEHRKETYVYATTYLAYILEKFYLRPNKIDLEYINSKDMEILLYIPDNCKRINKRASLNTPISHTNMRNVGIFRDNVSRLIFDCAKIDDRILDIFPLKINSSTRFIQTVDINYEVMLKLPETPIALEAIKELRRRSNLEKRAEKKKYSAFNVIPPYQTAERIF